MAASYAYVGAPTFIKAVQGRLADAGLVRADDTASADIVVTFCTTASALEDLYFGDDGLVSSAGPGTVDRIISCIQVSGVKMVASTGTSPL